MAGEGRFRDYKDDSMSIDIEEFIKQLKIISEDNTFCCDTVAALEQQQSEIEQLKEGGLLPWVRNQIS